MLEQVIFKDILNFVYKKLYNHAATKYSLVLCPGSTHLTECHNHDLMLGDQSSQAIKRNNLNCTTYITNTLIRII